MTGAPRSRFIHTTKQSKHYLFVTVPKITSGNAPSGSEFVDRYCYNPGDKWAGGSAVIPLTVTSNGELARCPEFGRSAFDSIDEALVACGPFDGHIDRYDACFGAILLDMMYFLVAAKTEVAMELPFGPVAHRIVATQWVAVALPGVPKLHVSDRDHRRLKEFAQHSFHPGCYYSDEADLSLPFPFVSSGIVGGGKKTTAATSHHPSTAASPGSSSSSSSTAPSPPELHSDWSHHLRKPFDAIALDGACSVMMSGFIAEHRLGLEDGQLLRVQLIGHKNHHNPGPRYYGRGLNHANAAGNDHVYELVVWRYASLPSADSPAGTPLSPSKPTTTPSVTDDGDEESGRQSPNRARGHAVKMESSNSSNPSQRMSIEFMRHVILRGTIPVHWTTELVATGLGEASMHFDKNIDKVLAGTVPYFQNVFRALNSFAACDASNATSEVIESIVRAHEESSSSSSSGPQVSLRCISLLRQSSSPGEEELARYFVDAVRKAVMSFSSSSNPSRHRGATNAAAGTTSPATDAPLGTDVSLHPHHHPKNPFSSTCNSGRLELAHVDWLNLVKQYQTEMAVGIFWQHAVPFLLETHGSSNNASPQNASPSQSPAVSPRASGPPGGNFSSGISAMHQHQQPAHQQPPLTPEHASTQNPLVTSGTLSRGGVVNITSVQTNFVRVNCADSLDRTNLGCFFTSLQVMMDMLRGMNVSFESFVDQCPVPAASDDSDSGDDEDGKKGSGGSNAAAAPAAALSLDESMMMDASTAQKRPSALTQRATNRFRPPFLRSWGEVRDHRRCPPAVIRALSEMFVSNGDTVAMMYTNSAALHSNLMRKLAGMKLAKSNAVISAQRRYENVFEDRKKFRHVELLLGRNIELHLPSVSPAFLVRPLPYESWSSALVLTGVPSNATRQDVETALRELWDTVVVPALGENQVKCSSSAICMQVFLETALIDEESVDTEGFLVTNSSVVFQNIPAELVATERADADDEDASTIRRRRQSTFTSAADIPIVSPPGSATPNTTSPSSATTGGGVGAEGFCDVEASDCVAVVEFDQDTCRVVDVVSHLMAHVPGHTVALRHKHQGVVMQMHRYTFPMEKDDSTKSIASSASDAVKKAANSLRSGLKSLVRGLN